MAKHVPSTIVASAGLKARVGNLWPMGQMQPAWTFDMAHITIFITEVIVQHRIKMKLHDKYLDTASQEK